MDTCSRNQPPLRNQMSVNQQMNRIWNSVGQTVIIEGVIRRVASVRSTFGGGIQMILSGRLPGRSNPLFTVNCDNAFDVQFV